MTNFKRRLADDILFKIKNEPLFKQKILPDIKKGIVFPAIRNEYISFYYAKNSLFKYDSQGFSTHIKYGFVPEGKDDCYIFQDDLVSISSSKDFISSYDKIKEKCMLYAGDEAAGVASLFNFSAAKLPQPSRYSLVDTEITFSTKKNEREWDFRPGQKHKTDQIDVLLYDNEKKLLVFCEAKLFSNKELWSKDNRPKVTNQLDRYNAQIASNEQFVLTEYKNYFAILKNLFGVDFNPPEKVFKHCVLLIFDFDIFQREKIDNLLIKDGSLEGYRNYRIGDIKKIELENLFKECSD